jgi:hypothetical protein
MQIETLSTLTQPLISATAVAYGGTAARTGATAVTGTAGASGISGISTAQAWAEALAQRLDAQQAAQASADSAEGAESSTATKDSSALASALASAVETIGERLGQATATASIGLLARRLGEGEITEDTIGEGLLDVLRLVDRNFGTAEGDALMATFNGSLNRALNDYFDNGLNETFYAASSGSGGGSTTQAASGLVAQMQDTLGQDAADLVAQLLEQGLSRDASYTGLRAALADAGQALEAGYGGGAADALSQAAGGALSTLGAPPRAPGLLLDVAV